MKILFSFLISLCLADYYVAESHQKLTSNEVKAIQLIPGVLKLEPFVKGYKTSHTEKLWELELSKDFLEIKKLNPYFKLIEADQEISALEVIRGDMDSPFDDLFLSLQWALSAQGQTLTSQKLSGGILYQQVGPQSDINWKRGITTIETLLKKEPVVAVIDYGIDPDHPELRDSLYKNEVECDDGVVQKGPKRQDRDRNGFPGDCIGWNFTSTSPIDEAFPLDGEGHGTHVAGIIAAKRDNGIGIAGVSDKIKILPIKVTGKIDNDPRLQARMRYRAHSRRIAKGIYYAISRGVDVINISLGWPSGLDTKFMRDAFVEANRRRVLVVAAAGNDAVYSKIYPCQYRFVVCVGSVGPTGKVSKFSNFGGHVDILAPGEQIVSTIPTMAAPLKLNTPGYDIRSGTSMAAPFVSATAALLKASLVQIDHENRRLIPVPNQEVIRRLFQASRPNLDLTKSLFGALNFDESFRAKRAPMVLPLFKEINDLVVDTDGFIYNPLFRTEKQFPLAFYNYGPPVERVTIRIESLNPEVSLVKNEFELSHFPPTKQGLIKLQLRVNSLFANNELPLKVYVDADGVKRSFQHTFKLARNLLDVATFREFSNAQEHQLFNLRVQLPDFRTWLEVDGKNPAQLRELWSKITDQHLQTRVLLEAARTIGNKARPTFIHLRNFEEKTSLFAFSQLDDKFVAKEYPFGELIGRGKDDFKVLKVDLNFDDIDDFLILSKSERGLLYHYLDHDFRPLFEGQSVFALDNNFQSFPNFYHLTTCTIPGTKVQFRCPLLRAIGHKTKVPQELEVFTNARKLRLYKIAPKLNENKIEFTSEEISLKTLKRTLISKYSGVYGNNIDLEDLTLNVVDLLPQKQQTPQALVSFGLGIFKKNLVINIHENSVDFSREVSLFSDTNNHEVSEVFGIDDGFVINGFSRNKARAKTMSVLPQSEELKYHRLQSQGNILYQHRASFAQDGSLIHMYETVDTIVAFDGENESHYRGQKFSFLPGIIRSEFNYPINLKNEQGLIPALYTDPTSVTGRIIYNLVYDSKKKRLQAPIRYSLYIPQFRGEEDQFCFPLEPTLKEDQSYQLNMACKLGKKYFHLTPKL